MSHVLSIKIRVVQSNLVNLKSRGTRDLFDTSLKLYVECKFMLLMNQDYFSVMLKDILVYTTCLDDHENYFFSLIYPQDLAHVVSAQQEPSH